MQPNEVKNYRQIVTLKDGVNVLLRPLTPNDAQKLLDLYEPASPEDVRYLYDDVKNPAVVQGWCENLEYSQSLPLLALVQDRVVGQATLLFGSGPERHVGELRIFLAKDFRKRGLGTKTLQTLIDLARRQNLYLLVAKVVANQIKVIKAFQNLDFKLQCTSEDYFMLPDGELLDLVTLILYLQPQTNDF
jgi:L-amino acid N-acyltransferase YncA